MKIEVQLKIILVMRDLETEYLEGRVSFDIDSLANYFRYVRGKMTTSCGFYVTTLVQANNKKVNRYSSLSLFLPNCTTFLLNMFIFTRGS